MTASLNAGPFEHVVEVLDFHIHGTEHCSMVLLGIDGNEPFECCVPIEELHIERNTPGAAATATEGEEPSNQEEGDPAMNSTPTVGSDIVHGREAALEELAARSLKDQEDGFLIVLSVARSGPFRAEITQYARRDEKGEIVFDELELTIDSSDQAGGQMFSDLTILDGQLDDFLAVIEQISADYRDIVGSESKPLQRNEDAIRTAADVREEL